MKHLSQHFSEAELACHCCLQCKVVPELLTAMEVLRNMADLPVIVLSGYRCPRHNKAVGGAPKSEHVLGQAVDIRVPGLTLQQMYELAEKVPAFQRGGIGVYDRGFIHVDVRAGGRARWAQVRGKYVGLGELVVPVARPVSTDVAARKEDKG